MKTALGSLLVALFTLACADRSSRPAPARAPASFTVRVTGGGPGPDLVLIPGLSCAPDVWDGAVARWSARHRLHLVQIAGFAGLPAIAPPLLTRVRDELAVYLDEQRLARSIVIGHSLGGLVALSLALSAPGRLGAVISVEGLPALADVFAPGADPAAVRQQAEALREMLAAMTPQAFAAYNRNQLTALITSPTEVDRIAATSGRSDPAAVGQAVYEAMTTDLRPQLARIDVPVLLILGGAFGPAAARAIGERQLGAVPERRIVVVEAARHFVMVDAPDAFFAAAEPLLR